MIARYVFAADAGEKLPVGRAYAFYSCLLSLLPTEVANVLHEQGETPLSQCLWYDRITERSYWKVSVFGESLVGTVAPVLDELSELKLNTGTVSLRCTEKTQFSTEAFVASALSAPVSNRCTLRLPVTASFKQNGRYVLLPQEHLILQSLLNKWNAFCPEIPLDDPDAVRMLENGILISDYSLRSGRYPLKDQKIPGFYGSLTMYAALPAPLMEIWNILCHFSEYSGVGIKTALGMGGILPEGTQTR